MTRVTNFGIKRTHVQAGFTEDVSAPDTIVVAAEPSSETQTTLPPKKKRKRTKMSQRDGNKAKELGTQEMSDADKTDETTPPEVQPPKSQPVSNKEAKAKSRKAKTPYVSPSELRRQKRIEERNATTTCFACREKGHAARDCPSSQPDGAGGKSKSAVGICYRCGSTKHTLSRCKKPTDLLNPLPFASCFVCSGKGHLASACPQNKAKGVYPNGGCCKLCGDTSHLAKDCRLRKQDSVNDSAVLGVGREAGADEDDFHTLKRRKTEVDRDEKHEEIFKRLADVKVGAHSGVVKPFGIKAAPPKKVVFF